VPRPQVLPGLRQLWRDATTLQLGLSPRRGTVITGLQAGDDALIAGLDGTNDLPALGRLAERHQAPTDRLPQLLRLLSEADLLVESAGDPRARRPASLGAADRLDLTRLGRARTARLTPDADTWSLVYPEAGDGIRLLASRTRRRVRVDGAGRVGAVVAVTLAAAGVGQVQVDDPAAVGPGDTSPAGDVSENLGVTRADGARSVSADGRLTQPPDLVVVVRDDLIDIAVADDLARSGRPHLAVVCGQDRVVVGPLVLPGRGPCLRCLDLHRTDRDPAWPQLAAQLLSQAASPRGRARGETASATAAAGIAALQVLGFLDGLAVPASLGRTLEVTLPDGLVEARRWPIHPACGCCPPVPGPVGTAPAEHASASRTLPEAIPRQAGRAAKRASHARPASMDDTRSRD
jgi:hypothetical protein